MFPSAAIAFVVAAAPDQLEELVRRSADVPHFRATFTLSSTVSGEDSEVVIACGGTSCVRVDTTARGMRSTIWSVDGVLALHSEGSGKPLHARVDCRELYAAFDAVEEQFRREFPQARARGELQSVASMRWMFDETSGKANFSIHATITTNAPTTMGWLETLLQKGVAPVEEGELLKFSTDGHFDISVSRVTGMLQDFRGRSPKGEIRVQLKEVDFATAPEAARFVPDAPAAGSEDISAELRRTVGRVAELELRKRMYETLAGAKGPLDGPESSHGLATLKVRSLCRRFHEVTLAPLAAQTRENAAKARDQILERLKVLRNEGKTPAELSAWVERQASLLEEQLASFDKSIPARTAPPSGTQELPNARELSALEAALLADLWRDTVVEPLMSESRRAFEDAAR